jgi:DUF971 family protein
MTEKPIAAGDPPDLWSREMEARMREETACWPTEIRLNAAKDQLHIAFEGGVAFTLDAEYLRVFSPSAEVQGHAPSERKVVGGKKDVTIKTIEQVGNYAIKPVFSDGHDTGLYTWLYLHDLGAHHDKLWAQYLSELAERGMTR